MTHELNGAAFFRLPEILKILPIGRSTWWAKVKSGEYAPSGDAPSMKLTDTACKNAKPSAKPRKMADGGGMYLEVMPNGSKYWRMKYRFAGSENRLALGVYPIVSLAEARERRLAAQKLLANNINPSAHKKEAVAKTEAAALNTFEAVARAWYAQRLSVWKGNLITNVCLIGYGTLIELLNICK